MTEVLDPPANVPAKRNGNGNAVQRIDTRVPASDSGTLKALMESQAEKLRAVLPRHLTPDRLVRVTLVAVSKSELLQKCTIGSILQCVMTAGQLGLDCSGVLGSAYMVPFWNKNIRMYEAQLIPGYRGLIDLARRSGEIEDINAHCVYASDEFQLELGAEPRLVHKPDLKGSRRDEDIVGAYMVAYLKGNTRPHIEFVPRGDIDKVRGSSKAADNGPWVSWFAEMCRKTAVKRGVKYLPMSVELADAIAMDNEALGNTEVIEAQTVPQRGTEGLVNRLQSQRPLSQGQTLVDSETGEEIQTAQTDLQSHDFVRPESEGENDEVDTRGVEAEAPVETPETASGSAAMGDNEKWFARMIQLGDSVELPEAKVLAGIAQWAKATNVMAGKEHLAKPKDVKVLEQAIREKKAWFAA